MAQRILILASTGLLAVKGINCGLNIPTFWISVLGYFSLDILQEP